MQRVGCKFFIAVRPPVSLVHIYTIRDNWKLGGIGARIWTLNLPFGEHARNWINSYLSWQFLPLADNFTILSSKETTQRLILYSPLPIKVTDQNMDMSFWTFVNDFFYAVRIAGSRCGYRILILQSNVIIHEEEMGTVETAVISSYIS